MRWHPVTRLAVGAVIAVEVLMRSDWRVGLVALLAVELPMAWGLGVVGPFRRAVTRLLGPVALSAALVTWAFPPAGTAMGPLAAVSIALRIVAGLGGLVLLLVSTPPGDLAMGLEEKGLPASLAYLTAASFQLVPAMSRRVERVRASLQARGADWRASLWSRARLLPALVVPVIVSELLAAEQRAATLMARGFGLPGRTKTTWKLLPERPWEPALRWLLVIGCTADVVRRLLFMIEVANLRYRYPGASGPALRVDALSVPPGEVLAVLGASGSGKTTLASVLGGLAPRFLGGQVEGDLQVGGVCPATCDRARLLRTVGVVFQDPFTQISGAAETVEEEVAFGLENLGVPRTEMQSRVRRVLDRVGVAGSRSIRQLSGGQLQKVALAAVLVLEPPVLVLDEPVSQLDPQAAAGVAAWVDELRRDGHTIVWTDVSTHPVTLVASRVYALGPGRQLMVPEALAQAAELGLREPLFVTAARDLHMAPRADREVLLQDMRAARG